jgi:tol-pal system protein YbgF
MVRFSILPCPAAGMVLLFAALLLPGAAQGQDRTTQDRLDRIERDLNMLERQVSRGAPTATGAPGDPATAASTEIRMERIEAQMRDLTGRVETIANGLDQLKQRLEQINSDFDVRLSQLSGTPPAAAPPRGAPPEPTRLSNAPGVPTSLFPPGTSVPPPAPGPSPIFGVLTPPGTASPRPPPPAPPAEPADTDPAIPAGTPAQQFNHAFGLVKQADYPAAETALRAFVTQHPNDPLAANAQYWLGETYYARNKYMEAAEAFAEGYKRYPKGPKAPDELLKLGMSLARADQKKSACVAFAQLEQLPGSSAAIRDRATAEKKHVGCT